MATVQDLLAALQDLKAAADAQKAKIQVAVKIRELEGNRGDIPIPDSMIDDLRNTTSEIENMLQSTDFNS